MGTRFDLVRALATWRQFQARRYRMLEEDLDELEVHLRAHVADLHKQGWSKEAAFREAVRALGDLEEAETEYRKVHWGKLKRGHKLCDELRWKFSMFKNYLKVAWRNVLREKGYSFINITGLAVGMACCLMIGLYLEDELSYDRFHNRADRLFVVIGEHPVHGRSLSTHYSLASRLTTNIPDIEQTTRFWDGGEWPIVREEIHLRSERLVMLTEPSFFEMFYFPVVMGDPVAVMNTPGGAVITESLARTFFGEENPIGQTLKLENFGHLRSDTVNTVMVGAVVKDTPHNSSIRFDLVASLSLLGNESFLSSPGVYFVSTSFKTSTAAAPEVLNSRISETVPEELAAEGNSYSAFPLTSLHLSGATALGLTGQPKFLYIFGSVALLILLIAAVNYVNLATAQAIRRAREVGVRKTMGARRAQLARQFLGESVLLNFFALMLALVLVALALPAFNRLFDKEMTVSGSACGFALPLLCGFVLVATIAASAYPAFVLSRFAPMEVLRGAGAKASLRGGRKLRQSLVVFQFTISAALIIGTAIIYLQLQYVQNKDMGFNGEQVIVVDLPRSLSAPARESLKQRILYHQGIRNASVANAVPSGFRMGYGRPVDEAAPMNRTSEERIRFRPAVVDYDFIPTLGIHLNAGRNFSPDFPTDALRGYVLNEAAVEQLGWLPEEAVGQAFKLGQEETPMGEIIGVVDNFHITSLHQEIEPVVLQLHTLSPVRSIPFKLVARLAPNRVQDAVSHIELQFSQIARDASFRYVFLDDVFDQMYRSELRLSRIITTFAGLAIFIACLGLFGLASFMVAHRTREIGVRKVLGASVGSIVTLLSIDFLKLVGIAFIVAAPMAYIAMGRWLENFVYRIDLSGWPLFWTGVAILGLAVLTVSYQAIKAALTNPVKSLRYE